MEQEGLLRPNTSAEVREEEPPFHSLSHSKVLWTMLSRARNRVLDEGERENWPEFFIWSPDSLCWAVWVLSHFSCVQLFDTVARQAPLSMGFSRQEYWSGFSCPPPGHLPDPGIKPTSLTFPTLAGEFFTTSAKWERLLVPNTKLKSK